MVIGFNLAGAAKGGLASGPLLGTITLLAIAGFAAFSRGFIGRISIFLGVVVGYVVAFIMGDVNTDGISAAKWVAAPTFTTPEFKVSAIILFIPVVLVLIAENVGHVKAVSNMTGKDLDDQMGNALFADGVATTLAGAGGVQVQLHTQKTSVLWLQLESIQRLHIGSQLWERLFYLYRLNSVRC